MAAGWVTEGELFAELSQLRDGWSSQGGEVKGSKLDEPQAAQLIDLMSRYGVFVNFFATDMATNDDAVVSAYKPRQADAITAGLTTEHNPKMTAQLRGLPMRFAGCPISCACKRS